MRRLRTQHHRVTGEAAPVASWPKSAFRISFGLIWLIDAFFKWRPGFHTGFMDTVKGAADGQPSWLHWWFKFWIATIQPHPHVWAYGVAALETLIALALILGFARKVTYIVTIISGLIIWAVAEGFGGPYTASSTDIGAAVIYAWVAFGLLMLELQAGTSRYSVDYYLEQRIPWWHKVAEFGAHNHPAPGEQAGKPLGPPKRKVGWPVATSS
jgi:nitrite reductase (NO-forming)